MITPCQICGFMTESFVHAKLGVYHHCKNCEFIYKDRGSYISDTKALKIYENHQNIIGDARYEKYFKDFIEDAVIPFLGISKRALDFGSGPQPVLAEVMRRDYGINMDLFDLFFAPDESYKINKYDLITSTEVIEHLESPIEYFQHFYDLLNKEGILAIMTQFHSNEKETFLNWHYMRDRSHISFFRYKTFEKLAEHVGFKILYSNQKDYVTLKKVKDE